MVHKRKISLQNILQTTSLGISEYIKGFNNSGEQAHQVRTSSGKLPVHKNYS